MAKVLMVLHTDSDGIEETSNKLCGSISSSGRLDKNMELEVAVLGACPEGPLKALGQFGIGRAYRLPGNYSSPKQKVEVLLQVVTKVQPELILLPAVLESREMAPLLALHLKAGFVSHCISIAYQDKQLLVVREAYQGQYQVKSKLTAAVNVLIMSDVNPGNINSAQYAEAEIVNQFASFELPKETALEVMETFQLPTHQIGIDEADVVLGIGRGVETKEDFQMMEELAYAIEAPIGGSRPAVDAGWIPFDRQIGQTGKIIAPKLYLAVAVSGAQQHISGVEKAKIIAINKDSQAPIFRVSDLGVIGDFKEVVPLLIRRLNELKQGREKCG